MKFEIDVDLISFTSKDQRSDSHTLDVLMLTDDNNNDINYD